MYVKSETSPTIFEVQGNKLYYTHRDEGVRDGGGRGMMSGRLEI